MGKRTAVGTRSSANVFGRPMPTTLTKGCDKIADIRAHYRAPSNDIVETDSGSGRNRYVAWRAAQATPQPQGEPVISAAEADPTTAGQALLYLLESKPEIKRAQPSLCLRCDRLTRFALGSEPGETQRGLGAAGQVVNGCLLDVKHPPLSSVG